MAKVFVITGPSGVGKGTLISTLLERVPDLELSISATTREPRKGEVDGRDYHFLTPRGIRPADRAPKTSSSSPPTAAIATARCDPRSQRRLDAGHSVVLEIEVQGARQVRAAMRESVQVFIAPPDPASLRRRLESRGTDSLEAIDARLEVAEQELAAQDEFAHRVVNDDLERAADELEGIVRAEIGIPLDSASR